MESLNLSQRTIVVEGSFAAGRSVLDCGGSHTAAVTKDGSLWQWGSGNDGRLGTGDHKRCDVPRRISGRELFGGPVASVAVGYLHTAVLTADGVLWTHGNGACGRLGLGDEEDRLTPTRLCQELFGNAKVLSVCCWWGHTVAVTNDGLTWTWGWGEYGQLGHNDRLDRLVPTCVESLKGEHIVDIAAGSRHSMALSADGHLYTWGNGRDGRLGHGDDEDQLVSRRMHRFGEAKVIQVFAGGGHAMAITADGVLWTWGRGRHGALGHGDTHNALLPTAICRQAFGGHRVTLGTCGGNHSMVVTSDGALWAFGLGGEGQLGQNDSESRLFPVRVGAQQFVDAKVVALAAGEDYSAVGTDDGRIWTWGNGCSGLGHGDRGDRLVPTRIEPCHLPDGDLLLGF